MKGPDVFIVVRTCGDGYGHNSYEYTAWYFDEGEADEAVKGRSKDGEWFSVEKVPAGTPMPERSRW